MVYGFIYKITCLTNNKIYIGKTTRTIKERWKQHCYDKSTDHFHNAIRKYGKENFKIEIICTCCDKFELNNKEIELISNFDCRNIEVGYNILPGGEGFGSGKDHPRFEKPLSKETKKKLFEANIGKKLSDKTKDKISKSNIGKIYSDETKKKLSEANIGKKHPSEVKDKISKSKIGKKHSDKTKSKMSESRMGVNNTMFGKNHSDQTKIKISESVSGENHNMFGKHRSIETKEKLSKTNGGENNPNAILNWKKVEEIRKNVDNLSRKELSKKYNVSLGTIVHILHNLVWKI